MGATEDDRCLGPQTGLCGPALLHQVPDPQQGALGTSYAKKEAPSWRQPPAKVTNEAVCVLSSGGGWGTPEISPASAPLFLDNEDHQRWLLPDDVGETLRTRF